MAPRPAIQVDPDVLGGKPVIAGTRISVELVLGLLGRGYTAEQVIEQYGHLTPEDVRACMAYAAKVLSSGRARATPR
ncbi:MAG: DUF433 domain-containing protein [Planctomycetaceae bacterium]|nr:DUF433 domain-containing protein [Planctomycetota bacterium]NUN53586.1 DUF433 domain-containing protein [Planctomycetaceae bacterium]